MKSIIYIFIMICHDKHVSIISNTLLIIQDYISVIVRIILGDRARHEATMEMLKLTNKKMLGVAKEYGLGRFLAAMSSSRSDVVTQSVR